MISLRDQPPPGTGFLPLDARLRLEAAGRVATPGSIARRRAIEKAYRYIDDTYPEYLKEKD